jgi:hypothetical protein
MTHAFNVSRTLTASVACALPMALLAVAATGGCRQILGIVPEPPTPDGGREANADEASAPDASDATDATGDARVKEDGGAWTSQDSGTTSTLRGLWGVVMERDGAVAENIFAVGDNGTILHSTGDGAWHAEDAGGNEELTGVWGSSLDHVVVTTANGILVSNKAGLWAPFTLAPPNLSCVWGTSDTNVYIGGEGLLHLFDDKLTLETDAGLHPLGIYGFGSDNIYAVGTLGGSAFIVHSLGNGAWPLQLTLGGGQLNAIWGSGQTDLYAVGTDPLIAHSSGDGKWIEQHVGIGSPVNAIWGSSESDVYAVSTGAILHSDGNGDWKAVNVGASDTSWNGIWGSNPNDVYVVGSGGAIVHHP